MRSKDMWICAALLASAGGLSSAAAYPVTGTAQASARILSVAGVQVTSPLVLPTVTAGRDDAPHFVGNDTSIGAGSNPVSNARLTVHGQAGDALSLAVPASFTVIRKGGDEALTVDTSMSSGFGLTGEGVALGGSIMNGDAASVDIGGRLALASNRELVPGPYEGLLVVVVQYN